MEQITKTLCQQIKQALCNLEENQEYSDAASTLALIIDHLPEIKMYLEPRLQRYYDKALPFTQKDVEQNISKFPPRYKLDIESLNCQNPSDAALVRKYFVKWVVMILKRDCIDQWRKQKKSKIPITEVSISQPLGNDVSTKIEDTIAAPTLSGLDQIYQQERQSLASKMRCYVEEDSEEKLKNCYLSQRGKTPERPHCNCQVLIKKRFLEEPPHTYKKISEELDVSIATIQAHVRDKCLPLLKEIAEKLIAEELEANQIRSQENE